MVKNIQKNLTNIVIIIGLVSSIGVGFSKFGKLELIIEQLQAASKSVDVASIEVVKENSQSISTNTFSINDHSTAIAILEKEIQLLNLQINEIKISNSNPLQ
jgi:replication fork clamp-binding protein CrfC